MVEYWKTWRRESQYQTDTSAENTPNVQKKFGTVCLSRPKSLGFKKKKLSLGVRSTWPELWGLSFDSVAIFGSGPDFLFK